MNKYIDAEKVIALIDAKLEDLGMSGSVWVGRSVLQELKNDIITSLQQEQFGWKPSEEQMEALSDACVEASTFKKRDILESLLNDIKIKL